MKIRVIYEGESVYLKLEFYIEFRKKFQSKCALKLNHLDWNVTIRMRAVSNDIINSLISS